MLTRSQSNRSQAWAGERLLNGREDEYTVCKRMLKEVYLWKMLYREELWTGVGIET